MDSAHWNVYLVTDGTNVIQFHTEQHGSPVLRSGAIALTTSSGSQEMSTSAGLSPLSYESHTGYEAAGGWIAWLVKDGGGATQVR